jgi:hypothetical protein
MKEQMNERTSKGLLIIPVLIAVALLTAFWVVLVPHPTVITGSSTISDSILTPINPPEFNPADLEIYYIARSVLSTVNITLLAFLAIKYYDLYDKTKSEFTLALLMFVVVLLVKDLMSSPFVIGVFSFQIAGLGPFALFEPLVELIALSFLLYLNIKY